jgi:hypothetical protein
MGRDHRAVGAMRRVPHDGGRLAGTGPETQSCQSCHQQQRKEFFLNHRHPSDIPFQGVLETR